ncbi:hypothetical protein BJ166DRAFT_534511 [Pestalotiopsis sp. NC0098]|nr:hypothetical protein BJ166DRAFT_534511 [Pestalotiopsis sp. NC0098]
MPLRQEMQGSSPRPLIMLSIASDWPDAYLHFPSWGGRGTEGRGGVAGPGLLLLLLLLRLIIPRPSVCLSASQSNCHALILLGCLIFSHGCRAFAWPLVRAGLLWSAGYIVLTYLILGSLYLDRISL